MSEQDEMRWVGRFQDYKGGAKMSFEKQVKGWIENGFRQECRKILDEHITNALAEMRERSNEILAELGLRFISQVSYVDNTNNIRIELSIPPAPPRPTEDQGERRATDR